MDAYGRPRTDLVDAGPARAHVQALQAAGMGWKRVAKAAGLGDSVVGRLLGSGGYRPAARIRPATAAALLAVTVDLAPGTLVDAAATWRRVHGMVAAGYPQAWIADQLGVTTRALQLGSVQVTHAHAWQIAALAERCALTPGPSAVARAHAARHGWTVDLLWADLTTTPDNLAGGDAPGEGTGEGTGDVDDVAVERACAGERIALTPAERAAAVARLAAAGHGVTEIRRRLSCRWATARTLLTERQKIMNDGVQGSVDR
jgi:hypothetical protein